MGERVMALADLDKRSPTEISRDAGLGGSYIRDLVRFPDRSPVMSSLEKLAVELGTNGHWLAYGIGEMPAVLREGAGGKETDLSYTEERQPSSGTPQATLRDIAPSVQRPYQFEEAFPTPPPAPREFQGEITRAPRAIPDFAELKKDLPVRATAAGKVVNGFLLKESVEETVRRPPALEGVVGAYAIRVIGQSMSPLHKPRDLCIIHPHLPYSRGDSVIIQTKIREGAAIESYVKTFVSETDNEIVVTQLSPAATIRFPREHVLSIHKVLTMNDILTG
jgi:hypothetical protein